MAYVLCISGLDVLQGCRHYDHKCYAGTGIAGLAALCSIP